MRRAHALRDLIADSTQAYFVAPPYIAWCWSDQLCGTIFRAVPTAAELTELLGIWDLVDAAGIGTVTDVRAMGALTTEVFGTMQRYVNGRAPRLGIMRHALLVSRDQTSAAAVGLMLAATSSWKAFADDAPAFAWAHEQQGAAASKAVDEVRRALEDEPPIVTLLRPLIRNAGRGTTLASIARTLGRSERSLQRDLKTAGTSFRRLLQADPSARRR